MATDEQEKKRGAGRPPWSPDEATRQRVQGMAQLGVTFEQIATLERVDAKTLRKHCGDELAIGKAQSGMTAISTVAQMMRGYRTVRGGQKREVDEKTQFNAAVKHLALVHGIHEKNAVEEMGSMALSWILEKQDMPEFAEWAKAFKPQS